MKRSILVLRNIEGYKWVMAIAILEVLVHCLMVFFIILSRINYRYELEWMEGASLIQVFRIISGQSLYLQPTLEYIPMIYPPLYFYLAAAITKIIGISFLPLRIVSFASSLGCFLIIYLAVKDKTNSKWISLVAAGSFIATFKLGGAWFDIARVDMLFIFLCLAGVYLLGKQTVQNSIGAGILFSLSFITKQTALPIFIVVALATFVLFRKQTLPFISTFILLTSITYFYLNATTNGWYEYYILTLPAIHQIKWLILASALQTGFLPVWLFIIIGFSPIIFGFQHLLKDRLHLYYYLTITGIIATSVLARINRGAYINTLDPAYAGLSIIFGLGIGWLTTQSDIKIIGINFFKITLWLAVSLQFMLLAYNPFQQIPTQADRQAGDAFVSELQAVPGDVLIPYHNYLALFAGKKVYFHMVSFDELRGTYSKKQPAVRDILREFHAMTISLFIMDLPDNLLQFNHCKNTQNIKYVSETTFYPVTGYFIRPTIQFSGCP